MASQPPTEQIPYFTIQGEMFDENGVMPGLLKEEMARVGFQEMIVRAHDMQVGGCLKQLLQREAQAPLSGVLQLSVGEQLLLRLHATLDSAWPLLNLFISNVS